MIPTGRRRPSLLLLLIQSALTQIVTFVLRPTITYRALELEVPAAWLGALGACFAVVPLIIAIPAGRFTDRVGEYRMMLIGTGLMIAAAVLFYGAGGSVGGLVLGSVVLGTGQLLTLVAQQAAVAGMARRGRFDSAFGHYGFATAIGQALGPAIIVGVGGSNAIPNTSVIFLAAAALGVTLFVCTLLLRIPAPKAPGGSAAQEGIRELLRVAGVGRCLLVSCLVLSAVDVSLVYLPALGADRGLASAYVGVLLVLRAVASMVTRLFLGQLSHRVGRKRLLIGSVVLSAVTMLSVTIPMPPVTLTVLVILLGLGLGVGQPLTMSWLAELAPTGMQGRAMSLRVAGNRLGQVVIPTAVGAVAVSAGAAGVLWASAATLGAAAYSVRRLQDPGAA